MSVIAKKWMCLGVTLVLYIMMAVVWSKGYTLEAVFILAGSAGIHLSVLMTIIDSMVKDHLDLILAHPVGKLPADDPIWKALERRKNQKERDKEAEYIGT